MAQNTEAQPWTESHESRPLQVVIVGPEATQIINVGPTVRELRLGRLADSDVVVTDALISERHARLLFTGDAAQIEDLGSTNGTWIARRQLVKGQVTPLPIGQSAQLGNTTLLLRRRPGATRRRRVWKHYQLMSRIEQECDNLRGTFAVLRIRAPLSDAELAEKLEDWLLPGDLLGHHFGSDYHALILDVSPPEAERRCREIANVLGPDARTGVAVFVRDGLSPDKLLEMASRNCLGDPVAQAVVVSSAMKDLYERAAKVASAHVDAVLICGETGTGKELLARFIHDHSRRQKRPFVAVTCGVLAPTLAASELFGHVRGAFTDAREARVGLFEEARGGTLFLDDIQNMPLEVQRMLLRVLQERTLRPVGARSDHPIDLRVIASSNQDLKAAIAAGTFAPDLYHRLGTVLTIPPLRERAQDIEPMARQFLAAYAAREGKTLFFTDEGVARLLAHPWPGNVRELKRLIEDLVIHQDGPEVDPDLPPINALVQRDDRQPEPPRSAPVDLASMDRNAARRLIVDTLIECFCYRNQAADKLGLTKRALIDWMKKLEIPVSPPKRAGKADKDGKDTKDEKDKKDD